MIRNFLSSVSNFMSLLLLSTSFRENSGSPLRFYFEVIRKILCLSIIALCLKVYVYPSRSYGHLQPLFLLPYSVFCKNQLLCILTFFSILLGIKSELLEMFEKISILIVKINCSSMIVVSVLEQYPLHALIYFSMYHDPKCICQL